MGYEWSELEKIFQESLSMPADKRQEYIKKKTSGNKALENTLMAMLDNSDDAEAYFEDLQEEIAKGLEARDTAPSFEIGQVIGKYKIKSLLGKGGMGEVYLAERNDGQFEQKVAIKCFSKAHFNKTFLENFRQEQQFLAKLNHGNIAHILDGGLSDNDIPYIIMEYVEGIPVDQYIQNSSFSEKQILNLFLTTCDTIQFAHNQLILHLDIKPNNILVSERGVVKLLDFGIARKIGGQVEGKHFMASPFYAAPEQFGKGSVSVSTDIFQLGVLLHVMIAGEVPFENKQDFRNRKLNIDEKNFSKELVAILRKCLHDDAESRYQSVNALSSDIRKYQKGFPVSVYSTDWNYKSVKYIKRNRVTVSLLALLFISMIVGTVFSLYQASIARKNEKMAIQEKERAEQVSSFLTDFFKSPNPRDNTQLGKDFTVQEFLKTGEEKAEKELGEEPEIQMELLGIISDMYHNLGLRDETMALDKKLIPRYQEVFGENSDRFHDSQIRLARNYSETGKLEKADSIFKKVLRNDELDYVNRANALTEYGLFYQNLKGDFAAADSLVEKAIEIYVQKADTLRKEFVDALSVVGTIHNRLTNFVKAENFYKRELAIKEEIIKNDPVDIALTKSNLATILLQTGKSEEALEMALSAVEVLEEKLGKKHLHTLHAYNNLSHIYLQNYQYNKAKETATKCLNLYSEAFGNKSYETGYVYANQVFFNVKDKDFVKAQENLDQASNIFGNTLPPQHYLHALISINQALINIKKGNPDLSLLNVEKAKTYLEQQIPPGHFLWGYVFQREGAAYLSKGKINLAEEYLTKAYEILKSSKGIDHYNTQAVIKLLSELYAKNDNTEKSEEYYSLLSKGYVNSKLY